MTQLVLYVLLTNGELSSIELPVHQCYQIERMVRQGFAILATLEDGTQSVVFRASCGVPLLDDNPESTNDRQR